MHISAVLYVLSALGTATTLGLNISQPVATSASLAAIRGALAALVEPSASATSAGPISLSTGANGITISMPSSAESVIKPHLEERQNCALLPSGSMKRDLSAGLACAAANAKQVLYDASSGTPLYNDLIISQTTCPNFSNFIGPVLNALHQMQVYAQTLTQWATPTLTLIQQQCSVFVVFALAYFIWENSDTILSSLIPNNWMVGSATIQPSAVTSSAPCPSETFFGTAVPVCCNVTQCNGDGTSCGAGSSWPNCPCESADDIDGQPVPAGILSQDLLQSIVSFTLPPLPATSTASTAPVASSTLRRGNWYYIPPDHPGGGYQGTDPV